MGLGELFNQKYKKNIDSDIFMGFLLLRLLYSSSDIPIDFGQVI